MGFPGNAGKPIVLNAGFQTIADNAWHVIDVTKAGPGVFPNGPARQERVINGMYVQMSLDSDANLQLSFDGGGTYLEFEPSMTGYHLPAYIEWSSAAFAVRSSDNTKTLAYNVCVFERV
jgi:hypothetical protein